MDSSKVSDDWDLKLEGKLLELKKCQQETMQIKSCTQCSKFFDCVVRKEYVKAVYESMNKGSAGGFEF